MQPGQMGTSGGLFGNNTQSQPSTSSGLFGNSTQNQPATTGGGLFGNNTQGQTSTGGLFGNNNMQNQPNTGSLFGNNTQSSSGGIFGNTQAPSTGTFGTNAQNSSSSGGLFGSKPAQPSGGLFGSQTQSQPGTGLFGSQTQSQPSGNLFGNQAQTQSSNGLFGNQAPSGGSILGSKPPSGVAPAGVVTPSPLMQHPFYQRERFNELPDVQRQLLESMNKFISEQVKVKNELGATNEGREMRELMTEAHDLTSVQQALAATLEADWLRLQAVVGKVEQDRNDNVMLHQIAVNAKEKSSDGSSFVDWLRRFYERSADENVARIYRYRMTMEVCLLDCV